MSRRTPSIGSQMRAHLRPYVKGKIDAHPIGYVYGSEGWTNPQGVFLRPSKSDDGRDVSFYRRRSVSCPSAEVGGDRPVVRGRYSVPETECKKCPHRMYGGCCEILRREAYEHMRQLPTPTKPPTANGTLAACAPCAEPTDQAAQSVTPEQGKGENRVP